jgi:hypothetical protein
VKRTGEIGCSSLNNARSEIADLLPLHWVGISRQEDSRRYTQHLGRERDCGSVIAGAGSRNFSNRVSRDIRSQRVNRASRLERPVGNSVSSFR